MYRMEWIGIAYIVKMMRKKGMYAERKREVREEEWKNGAENIRTMAQYSWGAS